MGKPGSKPVLPKEPLIITKGKQIDFYDAQPDFETEDLIEVPVVNLAEALGVEANWNSRKKILTLKSDKSNISLNLDMMVADINGHILGLDSNFKIKDGIVMAPLSIIVPAMGKTIKLDKDYNVIEIE